MQTSSTTYPASRRSSPPDKLSSTPTFFAFLSTTHSRHRTSHRRPCAAQLRPTNDQDSDPYSRYTHQIAIPLSANAELTSALRSIQTSLVRDCPRLIRACVMPALLRLPLLYVDAGRGADDVVERAVRDVVRACGEEGGPILVSFRGLELQGEDNSVLFAVGCDATDGNKEEEEEDDGVYVVDDWSASQSVAAAGGCERLERLVEAMQRELEDKHGFATCWPKDEPQGNEGWGDDAAVVAAREANAKKWRPRVPFVRLPPDFYRDLDDVPRSTPNVDDGDEGADPMEKIDAYFAKGYDGISPTFWYDAWAEQDILPSPGVRMRSVAVYRRILSGGGEAESSFHVLPPSINHFGEWREGRNRMDLPLGDEALMEREARERAREMERMDEVERREEQEWEEKKARWLQRGREVDLNESYREKEDYSEFHVSMEMGDVTVEGDAAYSTPWSERGVDASVYEASTRDAIESKEKNLEAEASTEPTMARAPSSSASSSQRIIGTPSEKTLPNIEDNPVFQRFWRGESQIHAQGEATAQTLDGTASSTEEILPPYPSNEHFAGVWRVMSSPLGTESLPDDGFSTQQTSDNLILRIDGQVMGGPILDAQYRHKAAGGSWKMFQAVRKRGKSAEGKGESTAVQTRLRIRLLVPPEKDRVLVMEGEVTRLGFGGKDASFSSAFVGAGGLLDGMSSDQLWKEDVANTRRDGGGETLIYCGGEAWMEDLEGGRRRKLGPFSLMKLKTVDRSKLIYTVPASRVGVETPESDAD